MKNFNLKELNNNEIQEQLTKNHDAFLEAIDRLPYLTDVAITNYIRCFEVCDKFGLNKSRIDLERKLAALVEKSAKESQYYSTVNLNVVKQKFLKLLAVANFNNEESMHKILLFAPSFLKNRLNYRVYTHGYDPTSEVFIKDIANYLPAENENFDHMVIFIRDNFLFFNKNFIFRGKSKTSISIQIGIIVLILKHFSIDQCKKAFSIFEKLDSFNLLVDAAFADIDWLSFFRKEDDFDKIIKKLDPKYRELYCFIQDIQSCQVEAQKNAIYGEKCQILINATNSIDRANRILSIKELSEDNKTDFLKNILENVEINTAKDFADFIKFLSASQCELLCEKLANDNKLTKVLYFDNYHTKPSLQGFSTVMNALGTQERTSAQEIAYNALESQLLILIQGIEQDNNNQIYDENDPTSSEAFKKMYPLYQAIQTVYKNGDYIFKPLSLPLRLRAYEKLKSNLVKLFDGHDKTPSNLVIFYICLHFLPQEKTREICEFFQNTSATIKKFQLRDFVWHIRWSQAEKIPAICKVFVRNLVKNAEDFKTILPSQERAALKFLLDELKDKINIKVQNMHDLKMIVDCMDGVVYMDGADRVYAKNIICTLLHPRIGQLIDGSSHINWLFKDLNDDVKILVINTLKLAIDQFKKNLPQAIKDYVWFSYGQYSKLRNFLDSLDKNNISSITLYQFFKYLDDDPFLQKTWQVANRPKLATQNPILDQASPFMQSNTALMPISTVDFDTHLVNGL